MSNVNPRGGKSKGRAGGDHRGGAPDRRRRKHWMLTEFGDGTTCACVHCGSALTFETLEADRIIPGLPCYAAWNIQPSCRRCNAQRSNNPEWSRTNAE